MTRHKVNLENAGFIPGDEFPADDKTRDSFSLILENSCLFCDIALRSDIISSTEITWLYRNDNWYRYRISTKEKVRFTINKTIKNFNFN